MVGRQRAALGDLAVVNPAERPVVVIDQQQVRERAGHRLAARLGRVVAGMARHRLLQLDVRDARQRQPLEAAIHAHEARDEVRRGMRQHVFRRAELGEPAALTQHQHEVGHLDRLVDVVGHEKDRLRQAVLEAEQFVLQPLTNDWIDRAERLVHQHQRRVGSQRAGDAHSLALTA